MDLGTGEDKTDACECKPAQTGICNNCFAEDKCSQFNQFV